MVELLRIEHCLQHIKRKHGIYRRVTCFVFKNVFKFCNTILVTGVSLSHYTAGAEKEIRESDQFSSADTRIARLACGLDS